MELASGVKARIEKHYYAFSCDICKERENSVASQQVPKNVQEEELPESNDRKGRRGIEFIDVCDTVNATGSLEKCAKSLDKDFLIEDNERVAVDPLIEEEWVPKKVLIDCKNEFKKKIKTLQIAITNLERATDKDAMKLRAKFLEAKIEALEARLKEKEEKLQAEIVLRKNSVVIEDRLEKQLKAIKIYNENLKCQLTTAIQQKNNFNNTLDQLRNTLGEKESKCREFELRCSDLKRELESCSKKYVAQSTELSKERLDLDIVEKWVADMSKSQSCLKKQLAVLNEDLRRMAEGQLTCEEAKTSGIPSCWPEKKTHHAEKRTRHFYATERDKLFEDYDNRSNEIRLELDMLRESVLMLRNTLAQKEEQCSFLEEELKVFRGELNLNDVKLEDIKDEETVEISLQNWD